MKNILRIALFLFGAAVFTACSDDNSDNNDQKGGANKTTTGVYILSEGSYFGNINGDLTSYDPVSTQFQNAVFATANGRALTGTANDGLVYGSKLYIANTDENVIEVANAKTTVCVKQITLNGARTLTADGGYIYVTSFTEAQVAKIDTATLEVVNTISTNNSPEGMAILDGRLYVANSGMGFGQTITKINLANFEKEATLTVPANPVEILSDGQNLYLRCAGTYTPDYSGYEEQPAVYLMQPDGATQKIAEATIAAVGNNKLYLIDNNWTRPNVTYSIYDLKSKEISPWELQEKPFYPYAMSVNPNGGDIYITSYNSIDYGTGVLYPDYSSNGYAMRFVQQCLLQKFDVGVNPGTIIFF